MNWYMDIGSAAITAAQARRCPRVQKAIQTVIDHVNRKAVSPPYVIKNWTIAPQDFTVEAGDFGKTY